jgi:hypothetical protein
MRSPLARAVLRLWIGAALIVDDDAPGTDAVLMVLCRNLLLQFPKRAKQRPHCQLLRRGIDPPFATDRACTSSFAPVGALQ